MTGGTRAAIRYAKAILTEASDKGNSQAVNSEMKAIVETIASSNELKNFLISPIVKVEQKHAAVSQIFTQMQPQTASFFRLLKENNRFELMSDIAMQYSNLFDEANGIIEANVVTAFPITNEIESKVRQVASGITNKTLTIKNTVDTSIIGGFILTIGDKQFNASVANNLRTLKREFSN
jgi:F-type H+-transporting ATPase subunit delta